MRMLTHLPGAGAMTEPELQLVESLLQENAPRRSRCSGTVFFLLVTGLGLVDLFSLPLSSFPGSETAQPADPISTAAVQQMRQVLRPPGRPGPLSPPARPRAVQASQSTWHPLSPLVWPTRPHQQPWREQPLVQPLLSAGAADAWGDDEFRQENETTSVWNSSETRARLETAQDLNFFLGALARIKKIFVGDGGMTKEKLASLGTGAVLSYGWVSNMNAACMMMLTWVTYGTQYGVSPLVPGVWVPYKPSAAFWAVYAGFYVTLGTFTRPFRLAGAIAISPAFDKIVNFFRDKLKVPKAGAYLITVFFANVLCTCLVFALGIRLATWAFNVPLFPA